MEWILAPKGGLNVEIEPMRKLISGQSLNRGVLVEFVQRGSATAFYYKSSIYRLNTETCPQFPAHSVDLAKAFTNKGFDIFASVNNDIGLPHGYPQP